MKLALFLSSDGIALAHRQPSGHWAMVGDTPYDVPDLAAALADLHALAIEREGDGFETLLVLPDDQILYTSLTAPTGDPELTAFRIEDGLDGLTPYAVTELEYDWREYEVDRVKIAVVARETLDEARNFAAQYGFVSAGFAAMPPMERFPGVPTFELGARAAELGFSEDGIAFGADEFGVEHPEPEPEPERETAADPSDAEPLDDAASHDAGDVQAMEDGVASEAVASQPETTEDIMPDPAITEEPGSAKRQGTVEGAEPDLGQGRDDRGLSEAAQDTESLEQAPLSEALMWAASSRTDDMIDDPSEAAKTTAPETDETSGAPVLPIEDPSLSGPVGVIDTDPAIDASPEPGGPRDAAIGTLNDDDLLPPAPSAAVREARERARLLRGETAVTPTNRREPGRDPFSAMRGRISPLESDAPRIDGPGAATGRVAAPDGAKGRLDGPDGTSGRVPGPDGDRGRLGAPDATRDSLLGPRSSRIGFGHPDDAPSAAAQDAATPISPPSAGTGSGTIPRLAEQLQRVRSASKSRPKGQPKDAPTPPRPRVEIDPTPALGQSGLTAERRSSPFDDTPPPATEPRPDGASRGLSVAGLFGRRAETARSEPTKTPGRSSPFTRRKSVTPLAEDAPTEPETGLPVQGSFASGLLARKAAPPAGGSFRTGLILTVVLLVLLALVAIWSAIVLPNSPVARFFGGGDTGDVASTDTGAPDAFSDVPALGLPAALEPSLEDEAAADGIDLAATELVVTADERPEDAPELASAGPVPAELPDIDADFELPPLAPIDARENPSLEDAEALYSQDGIWARAPERPSLGPIDLVERVYTAAIDPVISAFDAVALPDPGVNPGEVLRRFPPPPAFGAAFNLTAQGLIAPTPEGVLTPEGAFIISGAPSVAAIPRPREREVPEAAPTIDTDAAVLGTVRPAARPEDLVENRERQVLGGLTETELSERRPAERPASPQEVAARASLFPGDDAAAPEADADANAADVVEVAALAIGGTDLAVARSLMPRTRPVNIEQIVASAERAPPPEEVAAVAVEAVAAGPSIPSNSDVSRAATERDVIRLRNVNLIGVTGTASERRALVRLSSGRFVRVGVGDRLDGGRVAAIGETTLQYVRSGRTVTLEIPG